MLFSKRYLAMNHCGEYVLFQNSLIRIRTVRAEHSVGSVRFRTEPKEPKTEFLIFYGPNRTEINIWTEPEPNRNNSVRFGSFSQNRIFFQKYEKADEL